MDPAYSISDVKPYINTYGGLHDLNCYLVLIYACGVGKPVIIRQVVGYLLKENFSTGAYTLMKPVEEQYVKNELLLCLGSSVPEIRFTVGHIISVLLKKCGFHGWPKLLPTFRGCLNQTDFNCDEDALDSLYKICQECKREFLSKVPVISEPPIAYIAPRLYQLFQSPHASVRKLSLQILTELGLEVPISSGLSKKL